MKTAAVNVTNSSPFIDIFMSKGVRVAGSPHKPLFVAIDVAKLIGDTHQGRKLVKYTNKYLVKLNHVNEQGHLVEMNFLTERGLYKYLLQSDRPEAEAFQDWVYDRLCEIRVQIVVNKDLELRIAQDNLRITLENVNHMTVSFYDDSRLDSCPHGLAYFYITRFITRRQIDTGKVINFDDIPENIVCGLKRRAVYYFRKNHKEYIEMCEETLYNWATKYKK